MTTDHLLCEIGNEMKVSNFTKKKKNEVAQIKIVFDMLIKSCCP